MLNDLRINLFVSIVMFTCDTLHINPYEYEAPHLKRLSMMTSISAFNFQMK